MFVKLKYGQTNTFLIKGLKNILIDTDYMGTINSFYKEIKNKGIRLDEIDYVLITHYHPDHMGIVSLLMNHGIKLIIVKEQIPFINFSEKIFKKDGFDFEPIDISKAIVIEVEQSRDFLNSLGIKGEILLTPSHSEDSISIVLDNGCCFVGDLEPIEYLDGYLENDKLKKDWDNIIKHNPKFIYYAHINEKYY